MKNFREHFQISIFAEDITDEKIECNLKFLVRFQNYFAFLLFRYQKFSKPNFPRDCLISLLLLQALHSFQDREFFQEVLSSRFSEKNKFF